jgi:hypothetical protein
VTLKPIVKMKLLKRHWNFSWNVANPTFLLRDRRRKMNRLTLMMTAVLTPMRVATPTIVEGVKKMNRIIYWLLAKRGITWGSKVEKPLDKFLFSLL